MRKTGCFYTHPPATINEGYSFEGYVEVQEEVCIKCVDSPFSKELELWSPNLIKYIAQTAIRAWEEKKATQLDNSATNAPNLDSKLLFSNNGHNDENA